MDRSTVDHYNRNADAHAARYEQTEVGALRAVMRRCLTPGSRVLDIGCGSGRDAAFLLEQGHDVTAADAAPEMIAAACTFHPELADRTIEAGFPLPPDHPLLKERFDAVCAVAMIMHVPAELLFEFALQLKQMLRPGGTLIVSASENRPGLSDERDPHGRLFAERPAGEVQLLFERLGFRQVILETNADAMGRNIGWYTLALRRADDTGPGPVDQIETVINRDRKDATYKLALLRALCDIAQTEQKQAVWDPDGSVRVPLGLVAEKWLVYYWPIVEADLESEGVRIPQKRGLEINKPIAFRGELRSLIEHCATRGRLDTFYSDKLISRERLRHSRDRVIDYWTAARNEHPRQFDYEMQRSLIGGGGTSETTGRTPPSSPCPKPWRNSPADAGFPAGPKRLATSCSSPQPTLTPQRIRGRRSSSCPTRMLRTSHSRLPCRWLRTSQRDAPTTPFNRAGWNRTPGCAYRNST